MVRLYWKSVVEPCFLLSLHPRIVSCRAGCKAKKRVSSTLLVNRGTSEMSLKPEEWEYLAEGGAHILFKYLGEQSCFVFDFNNGAFSSYALGGEGH